MDNTWDQSVSVPGEDQFIATINEYFTLVDNLGRVPHTHPIHEQVRISREKLISALKE